MRKHWKDLVVVAAPFIEYLEKDSYFAKPYSGDGSNKLIIQDGKAAFKYASDDSFDDFDEWETVTDSEAVFPESFDWSSWIDHNLHKNRYFGIEEKNFNGADIKLTQGPCLLHELMIRDMRIILNCYSNEYFPDIWKTILDVYLHDGFPCGWDGRYPEGKLVVFSNF